MQHRIQIRWALPDLAPPISHYWPLIIGWIVGSAGYVIGVAWLPAGHWRVLVIGGATAMGALGWSLSSWFTAEPAWWDGHVVFGQRSGVSMAVAYWTPLVPRWGAFISRVIFQGLFVGWVLAAWHMPGRLGHALTSFYAVPMVGWRRDALATSLGVLIPGVFGAPWHTICQGYDDQGRLVATGWGAPSSGCARRRSGSA